MKQSLDFSMIGKKLSNFLWRFHSILFFVVIGAALIVAMMMIVSIINLSGKSGDTNAELINGNFDQTTIDQLKALSENSSSGNLTLPSGRINPFVE